MNIYKERLTKSQKEIVIQANETAFVVDEIEENLNKFKMQIDASQKQLYQIQATLRKFELNIQLENSQIRAHSAINLDFLKSRMADIKPQLLDIAKVQKNAEEFSHKITSTLDKLQSLIKKTRNYDF